MSSINSVRKLQLLNFSMKNKKIKNLKDGEKKWPDIGTYTYYCYSQVVTVYLQLVTSVLPYHLKTLLNINNGVFFTKIDLQSQIFWYFYSFCWVLLKQLTLNIFMLTLKYADFFLGANCEVSGDAVTLQFHLWYHSFSTYLKFSEELTFTPSFLHVRVRVKRVGNVFRKILRTY